MKKQVLFVHGGGEGAHEEDKKLAASLRDALGSDYDVRSPKMPDEGSPEYAAWRDLISEELAALDVGAILVGHSLGASVLLKYLSEEESEKPVVGLFLVAPPYWGAEDWEVGEYALQADFASELPEEQRMFFYHSRDDEWVPFAHLALYAEKLPRATIREFDDRGHQFDDDLSEVARDIENLKAMEEVRPNDVTTIAFDRQETDLPIGLGKPARRALLAAGYRRLEQLGEVSEAEVKQLHGVGPKALELLRRALDDNGLSFAER